ncbi:hypothetical protein LTR56_015086 [Elasticomyces elasticus]|nr:hypothetical protein LTR56_015086 [Elasticomyces elasticus]KAK3639308.1 hypothetical protein LTR22_017509 [Elasticomyces elasticus]KAK4915721.1 hypothetical protein LTR49_016205 [Elasticomyces elasticus]KAK5746072.1 hypothetical protein LTS12_022886 [Elasticomyces elasticus]
MRSNMIMAAAIARIAAAAPAPAPQNFDFAMVEEAPAPSVTGPPINAVGDPTSTFSVNTASIAASVAAQVTTVATASVTGASASAASTQEPTATALAKRGLLDWLFPTSKTTSTSAKQTSTSSAVKQTSSSSSVKLTSSTSTSSAVVKTSSTLSTSSAVPTTSSASTTSQQSTTSTISSDSSCPTTPEEGTYCGFINPEDPCAPQPDGYGPQVKPDTIAAFQAYPEFQKDALNAVTPSGYDQVFKNLNASTSANSYITFMTLESYGVSECASYCDNTDLCTAFNIYIERDPGINPTRNGDSSNSTGEYCPNPTSITNYKCSLWGSSIDNSSATNAGGWREDFQVVIVGSNGYDKTNNTTPPSMPGYEAPSPCDGAISAGGSYWLGSKFFPGPFNPSVCSAYAQAQVSTNKKAAQASGATSYVPCNQFNAYMVKKNQIAQGTYCSLFNTVLSNKWAGFTGGWQGKNFFGVESSYTYALSQQDSGKW